jgi:SsrA-binding protein
MSDSIKKIARNKKAFHNYEILDKMEAGIVLHGTEIKSVRESSVTFRDSFVDISNDEMWLVGFHIAPYNAGNIWNHDEGRKRKLLLKKIEIRRWHQKVKERGLTIVPLDIYLKNGKAKMTIGLAKGKAAFDKRDSIKKKDMQRDMQRSNREMFK